MDFIILSGCFYFVFCLSLFDCVGRLLFYALQLWDLYLSHLFFDRFIPFVLILATLGWLSDVLKSLDKKIQLYRWWWRGRSGEKSKKWNFKWLDLTLISTLSTIFPFILFVASFSTFLYLILYSPLAELNVYSSLNMDKSNNEFNNYPQYYVLIHGVYYM